MGLFDRITAAARVLFAAEQPAVAQVPVGPRGDPLATPNPWQGRDAAIIGNALTPDRLTRTLFERNAGYLQLWVDLADEAIEKDPHLASQLITRQGSVVETEFRIVPGKGSNGRAAKRAADACTELYEFWQGRELEGLETWLAEFVGAKYYGRGAHEILWESDGTEVLPVALSRIDTRRLSYACPLEDPNPWRLRLWDEDVSYSPFGNYYGRPFDELPSDKVLINEPYVRGAQRSREGLFALVVWFWLFRVWSWRDLMSLAEMIGRPPVIAYFAAGGAQANADKAFAGSRTATAQDVAAAKKAVHAVSGALRAVLPDTVRMEALDYQMPTSAPIQLLINGVIDSMQSKVFNGSSGATDIVPGSRAAQEVGERAGLTPWRSDCRMVARLLTSLFRRYIRANPGRFGEGCPIPVAVAQTDPPKDVAAALLGLSGALDIGLKVPESHARLVTGIPAPQMIRGVEEPVLERPKAPAPPAPPATDPANPDGADRTPPTDAPKA